MDTDTIQLEMDFWDSKAAIMVYRGCSATCHNMTTMQAKQEVIFRVLMLILIFFKYA